MTLAFSRTMAIKTGACFVNGLWAISYLKFGQLLRFLIPDYQ